MRWSSLSLVFVLLLTVSCTSTQQNCQGCEPARKLKPRVSFVLPEGKEVVVTTELACTQPERQRGLMYRKSLGASSGMLFLFPYQQKQSFWMKNTFIPLDMIHINTNKEVVGIVENAKPHTLTSRSVGAPARYVLEVNAFFARKNGIRIGQKVKFLDIPEC